MAWRVTASLSWRAASIRAEDAWLNEMDIAPAHLLDSKPDHAVRIAVTASSTTAMISCSPVGVILVGRRAGGGLARTSSA